MKIVIPHSIQTVAHFTARCLEFRLYAPRRRLRTALRRLKAGLRTPSSHHLRFLQIVLCDKNDRTRTRRLARRLIDCANDVFLGPIANGVRRVEAEAIEMKFFDPITSVRNEKFANWS